MSADKNNEGLCMQIGDALQLQPVSAEAKDRYAVRVIGYLAGKSLIVTAPQLKGRLVLIREGQRFAVRTLQGSSVVGFVSSVLQSCCKPFPYLHLSYPDEMESIVVRNAQRVNISLAAQARNMGDRSKTPGRKAVEVSDLSNTGARLYSSDPLGKKGEGLQIDLQLPVDGLEERLTLMAVIRNVKEESTGLMRYGIQFQAMNRFQSLVIHSYVLEHRLEMKEGG